MLFKGAKGVYLDATVFVELDQADQYGNNGMITQNESKQNRDAGMNGPILGNCKVFWKESGQQTRSNAPARPQQASRPAQQPLNQPPAGYDDFDSDIPF